MNRWLNKRETYWSLLFMSVVVLVLSTFLAVRNLAITGWELGLLSIVNQLPELFTWPVLFLTQIGSAWLLLGVAIGLALRHRYRLSLRLVSAGGLAFALSSSIKVFVARARPNELYALIVNRELAVSGFGFPSGHTALATAVCVTLWPVIPPQYRWLLFVLPLVVGFTRLYLGVHAPIDILGGLAVGMIAGTIVALFRRFPPFITVK